jgi:succinate-semialdehyde dehydrogenase/glutarate-semialdehyde dehydrogenase
MPVTQERISSLISAVPTGLYIAGRWESTDATVKVEDPATGEVLTAVADASPADGIRALDAAVDAAEAWAATEPRARGEILRRAFDRCTSGPRTSPC